VTVKRRFRLPARAAATVVPVTGSAGRRRVRVIGLRRVLLIVRARCPIRELSVSVNQSLVGFVSDDVKVRSEPETELDFDVVFGEQYPKLVAIGVALTGSVEVANDLAQETMARAHRNWSQVSTADAPNAWLRRVMKNLIVDHFRRQGVEVRTNARVARRRIADNDGSVEQSAVSTMSELLSVLPERQQMAVALRYVDDLSVAEIATVLEVAVGTVKATLWKARRRLERHLRTEADHG